MLNVFDLSRNSIFPYWYVFICSSSTCSSWCHKFNVERNISLQVTGGGGYTKENVARCWTVETGVLLDTELPNGMPI